MEAEAAANAAIGATVIDPKCLRSNGGGFSVNPDGYGGSLNWSIGMELNVDGERRVGFKGNTYS